jgi:hypothetical protein
MLLVAALLSIPAHGMMIAADPPAAGEIQRKSRFGAGPVGSPIMSAERWTFL